jgi:hypothetical protein
MAIAPVGKSHRVIEMMHLLSSPSRAQTHTKARGTDMATRSFLWIRILGAMLLLALGSTAQANIWLDENFEGDNIFVQLEGTTPGASGWDSYSADPLLSPASWTTGYTETGLHTAEKAFRGEKSYHLGVGQSLAVGTEYQDPQNGNFQLFQFAINVDPIPAAGTVATFRWGQDMNSLDDPADHSFYVRLDSDGTKVTIYGGEDEKHDPIVEGVLGTLDSTDDWAFISILSQKDAADTPDSRFPFLGNVSQGVHFFNSSETPALSIDYIVDFEGAYAGREWNFTVESGAIYLDELYWDGGLDDDAATSNFRPFDLGATSPASVTDWMIVE